MSRPWIKQPVNKLNDARLSFVSVQAQRDYFMLYLLAGQLDTDGLFYDNGRRLEDKEIAFRIHVELSQLRKSIKELQSENLIHVNGKGPMITDWNNEQIDWRAKQESERERQQQHRAEKRDSEYVTRDSDSVTRDGDDVTLPDKKKTRPEVDKKKTRPDQIQPRPVATASVKSSSKSGRVAGSKDEKKDTPSTLFKDLKGKQLNRARQALKILGSLGIRNPKLETTSVILATRKYNNDPQMVNEIMGAIASTYSDGSVKSKEAVVIHRIETGKIPQSFIDDPALWRSVPIKTLEIAGIGDIDAYKYKKSISKYQGAE